LCPAKVVRSNGGLRIPGDAERRETVTAVWYVYFLELANSDVYVGSSNDLRRRFKSIRMGKSSQHAIHCRRSSNAMSP
jgi:GIY-YIG catalytic domain